MLRHFWAFNACTLAKSYQSDLQRISVLSFFFFISTATTLIQAPDIHMPLTPLPPLTYFYSLGKITVLVIFCLLGAYTYVLKEAGKKHMTALPGLTFNSWPPRNSSQTLNAALPVHFLPFLDLFHTFSLLKSPTPLPASSLSTENLSSYICIVLKSLQRTFACLFWFNLFLFYPMKWLFWAAFFFRANDSWSFRGFQYLVYLATFRKSSPFKLHRSTSACIFHSEKGGSSYLRFSLTGTLREHLSVLWSF